MTKTLTSRMNSVQLAKTVAENLGWKGGRGGWIYDADGQPLAHGWNTVAAALVEHRFIVVGAGVDWRRMDVATVKPSTVVRARRAR